MMSESNVELKKRFRRGPSEIGISPKREVANEVPFGLRGTAAKEATNHLLHLEEDTIEKNTVLLPIKDHSEDDGSHIIQQLKL